MPRQLASDLRRFFNLNIKDWHQASRGLDGELVLSSFELLELFGGDIEVDPDTGDVHPDQVVYVWHNGQLSRRLYASMAEGGTRTLLVEYPPEGGAVDRAMRDGGYTRAESMAAETHNEIARLRASYHAVNGGEAASYEPFQFLDPRVEAERERERREREEFQREAEHALFGALDW